MTTQSGAIRSGSLCWCYRPSPPTRAIQTIHDIDIRDVATAQLLADVTEVDR
jgi:hypothetical protein